MKPNVIVMNPYESPQYVDAKKAPLSVWHCRMMQLCIFSAMAHIVLMIMYTVMDDWMVLYEIIAALASAFLAVYHDGKMIALAIKEREASS